jgi:hypothetical protein
MAVIVKYKVTDINFKGPETRIIFVVGGGYLQKLQKLGFHRISPYKPPSHNFLTKKSFQSKIYLKNVEHSKKPNNKGKIYKT